MAEQILVVAVVAVLTFFIAFGAVFFKLGSAMFSLNVYRQLRNYKLMLGVLFYMLPMPVYLWALKNADLAVVFPINALTYVWVSFLSVRLLGERMSIYKWLGVVCVIFGVALISYSVV